jgi:hypothetical protein
MVPKQLCGLAVAGAIVLSACAPIDQTIRNPLSSRRIDGNRIVKGHSGEERFWGLSRGTLTEQASLVSVDEQRICFLVTLHHPAKGANVPSDRKPAASLEPPSITKGDNGFSVIRVSGTDVELNVALQGRLTAPGLPAVGDPELTVSPLPPLTRHQGRVFWNDFDNEEYCADYDNGACVRWATRTVQRTRFSKGEVLVGELTARLCFQNSGLITTRTEWVALELEQVRFGDSNKVIFRWGFRSER